MTNERWERDTTVRALSWRWWRWVPLAMPAAIAAMIWAKPIGVFVCFALFMLIGRAFMPDERRARLVADRDGLRIDGKLFPRRAIAKALLRHEGQRTFVALDGRRRVDVEVPNNVEADALVRALGLDSESAVMEFPLTHPLSGLTIAAWLAFAVGAFALSAYTFGSVLQSIFFMAALLLASAIAATLATRVKLRVGADGIVLRRPLRRDVFLPHDALVNVRAEADSVVLEPPRGRALELQIPDRGNNDNADKLALRADEAAAIARRIQQARRAFRDHAGAGAAAAVLDRRDRAAREWLAELRRLGEGAASTFRTVGLARSQLFQIVESTTASARERIAAAIALRARMADEEKPRIRVAAERCAEPELRERMIRVLEADDETELERVIDEMSG